MTTLENTVHTQRPNFGEGRFSAEMERIYNACIKLFGLDESKAEKIARQAASDAGAALKAASASLSVSAARGKDKTVTISDASKVKGVTLTNALAVVRAIQWIDDAGKNFVSYGFTGWKLAPQVQEWIDGL